MHFVCLSIKINLFETWDDAWKSEIYLNASIFWLRLAYKTKSLQTEEWWYWHYFLEVKTSIWLATLKILLQTTTQAYFIPFNFSFKQLVATNIKKYCRVVAVCTGKKNVSKWDSPKSVGWFTPIFGSNLQHLPPVSPSTNKPIQFKSKYKLSHKLCL